GTSNESTIEFRSVAYSIPLNLHEARDKSIVAGISLTISSGETGVLLGRSGSGKTTLLKLINRLLLPTNGQVLVQGRPTSEWDPIGLRRGIGYVIQEAGLFPHY